MTKPITITLTDREVEDKVKSFITGPHKELVMTAIIESCKDTDKLDLIIKASLGIVPKLKYKVGQEVLVGKGGLSMWQYNETAMKEKGIIDKDDQIVCIIVDANPYKHQHYDVSHDTLNSDGEKGRSKGYISESYIKGIAEEFPEDMIKNEETDDYPF